jgi:hypothetical protein
MTRDEHIARYERLLEEHGRCTDENEDSVLLQQIGELEIMLFHTAPMIVAFRKKRGDG